MENRIENEMENRMENGMDNGKWKMENGKWKMEKRTGRTIDEVMEWRMGREWNRE